MARCDIEAGTTRIVKTVDPESDRFVDEYFLPQAIVAAIRAYDAGNNLPRPGFSSVAEVVLEYLQKSPN